MSANQVMCPWCGAVNRLWKPYWLVAGALTFGIALMIPSVCGACGKGYMPGAVRKELLKWVLLIDFIALPVLIGVVVSVARLAG